LNLMLFPVRLLLLCRACVSGHCNVAQSPNCQKPSRVGWLDGCMPFRQTLEMMKNRSITMLIKAVACLVMALFIVLFPPSAAHAGSNMHASRDAMVAQANSSASHHAVSNDAAQSTSPAKCSSDVKPGHADTGAKQCCSGICLTVVLINEPVLRQGQVSISRFTAHATEMPHVDPNGFLRPPKLLI
jgi:hypothetical protein